MYCSIIVFFFFFFSSRRRHTRLVSDWSSDVCSSDLADLDAIADFERAAPDDECPPGEVRYRFLEGDRQPCGHQPQVGRERGGSDEPRLAHEDHAYRD